MKNTTQYLRKHNWLWYSNLVDKCSNPHCKSKSQLEVHHIIPLSMGGQDTILNCIVLCFDCHHSLGLHSDWEYYHTVELNWKIKIDNDILNKFPTKYKNEIVAAKFLFNNKLINLDEGMNNKEYEYQKLQIKRHTLKEIEYQKGKLGFNQYCIDYECYHSLIESQLTGRW